MKWREIYEDYIETNKRIHEIMANEIQSTNIQACKIHFHIYKD